MKLGRAASKPRGNPFNFSEDLDKRGRTRNFNLKGLFGLGGYLGFRGVVCL